MENATKALLIAAGMLIGLMLITTIMYGHNRISNYYNEKQQSELIDQLSDFNAQYIPYNRNDVRGSDLLSLINKIIDFNTINKDEEKIEIAIVIEGNDKAKNFFYNYDKYYESGAKRKLILFGEKNKYTQDNIYNKNGLIDKANDIESKYIQGMPAKLAANIATIMGENSRKDPEQLLTELKLDKKTYGSIQNIQDEILQYYQYQQFKRAHFNCEELLYTKQGRVKSFKFKFNDTFE